MQNHSPPGSIVRCFVRACVSVPSREQLYGPKFTRSWSGMHGSSTDTSRFRAPSRLRRLCLLFLSWQLALLLAQQVVAHPSRLPSTLLSLLRRENPPLLSRSKSPTQKSQMIRPPLQRRRMKRPLPLPRPHPRPRRAQLRSPPSFASPVRRARRVRVSPRADLTAGSRSSLATRSREGKSFAARKRRAISSFMPGPRAATSGSC